MPLYGYARVSTLDQDLSPLQIEALKIAGCDIIRAEKVSGTSTSGRDELATLLDFIREGDPSSLHGYTASLDRSRIFKTSSVA